MQLRDESKSDLSLHTIVLFGKIGHGKTHIINKLCNTLFESNNCPHSCTLANQVGKSAKYNITMIDTPGFFSARDVDAHVSAQKVALQMGPLSGIYVVVKMGRVDEIADIVDKIMDFVGSDDVRIIITHADTTSGYNEVEIKQNLYQKFLVEVNHIHIIGKDFDLKQLEDFIVSSLHAPKRFAVCSDQYAYVSTFGVGARQYTNDIESIQKKIEASIFSINSWLSKYPSNFTRRVVSAIVSATDRMIRNEMERILHSARELPLLEISALRKKLEIKKLNFMERTQSFSRYAPTDIIDVKFLYIDSKCTILYTIGSHNVDEKQVILELMGMEKQTKNKRAANVKPIKANHKKAKTIVKGIKSEQVPIKCCTADKPVNLEKKHPHIFPMEQTMNCSPSRNKMDGLYNESVVSSGRDCKLPLDMKIENEDYEIDTERCLLPCDQYGNGQDRDNFELMHMCKGEPKYDDPIQINHKKSKKLVKDNISQQVPINCDIADTLVNLEKTHPHFVPPLERTMNCSPTRNKMDGLYNESVVSRECKRPLDMIVDNEENEIDIELGLLPCSQYGNGRDRENAAHVPLCKRGPKENSLSKQCNPSPYTDEPKYHKTKKHHSWCSIFCCFNECIRIFWGGNLD